MGILKRCLFVGFAILVTLTLARWATAQSTLPVVRTLSYNQISLLTANPGTPQGTGRQFPSISANGSKLVFSQTDSSGAFHVYSMNADGSGQTQLDTYKPLACCGPAMVDISSDGSKIVSADPAQIRINGSVLAQFNDGQLLDVKITGDGTKIHFMIGRDTVLTGKNTAVTRGIWVINSDGTGMKQIVTPSNLQSIGISGAAGYINFAQQGPMIGSSTDGTHVVFGAYDSPVSGGQGQGVFAVNADGTGLRDLIGRIGFTNTVNISGDGTKVGYTYTDLNGGQVCGVVNFDGSGKLNLTDSTVLHPGTGFNLPDPRDRVQLTNDGTQLLMGNSGLLYSTASGSSVVQLAARGGYFSSDPVPLVGDGLYGPSMNSTGTRVLYLQGDNNNIPQLAVLDVNPASPNAAAPVMSNVALNPAFMLVNTTNAVASAQVTAAGSILRVGVNFLLNGLNDGNVFNSNPLFDDGTHGDTKANDGTYTGNNNLVEGNATIGGRTMRVKAETKTSDGLRHATAVEVSGLSVVTQPPTAPTVSSTSPFSGKPGASVTINGTGFSTTVGNDSVSFGGQSAQITSVTATTLNVVVPSALAPGVVAVSVAVFGQASNSVNFTVTSGTGTPPVINTGGVVGGANFLAVVTAAGITSVFGTNFTTVNLGASTLPLPTTLGGVTIHVNAIPAPLFFVSPTQINFLMPYEVLGLSQATITATTSAGDSLSQTISLQSVAPGIFAVNAAGQGAVLISQTGQLAAPTGSIPGLSTRPVQRGEFVTIYCTGLGAVTNPPATGAPAPNSPLSNTTATPTVTIGGVAGTPTFSGLSPGFVGLYQINVAVPSGAPSGSAVSLVVGIGGVNSNTVTIAVQ